jgi:Tfp pilus assembly protein PilV
MRHLQSGFTLIEVLILSPILMVTVVLLMSYLFNQYGQLTQQGALINLQTEAQNIVFSMQDDLFFARSFESDKNTNLTDTYQPAGGWKSNTTPPTLIISDVALTTNRRNATRIPVYINTYGCSPQATLEQNDELFQNTIYFVSGTNLYKRILTAPSTLSICGTPFQKQTCPSGHETATCPLDRQLTDKLNTFSITYYDTDNNVTTTPENAEKVKVSVQLKDKAFAEDIYADSSITLKKLNQ